MEKGYTIPIVDLAGETERQTVLDREEHVYLGHVTTVLLEDGRTIIAVYPKNHGNGAIVLRRSTDGGLTWSPRLPVPESWVTSMEVPTIYRTVSPDGQKHLILFSGMYPIRMAHSEDDGVTWSELEPIGDYGGIVAMGDVEPLGGGRYVAMFHDDGRYLHPVPTIKTNVYRTGSGTDVRTKVMHQKRLPDGRCGDETPNWQRAYEDGSEKWEKCYEMVHGESEGTFTVYQVISEDGGLTWSKPRGIASLPDANICEPAIIRSPDGKQLTVLFRENSRRHNGYRITSNDNAKTWSEPVEMPAALTGDRHTSQYLKDGRLFISFRDTTLESATRGDWVGWIGTYDDIINNREGQYRIRLMKNRNGLDCAYPGVLVLPDGTVVATTYGHWTEGEMPYIVSVRFRPEETDEKYRAILKEKGKETMNETLQNIYTRRSVRSFSDKPIPADLLKQIANAARYAPSARNQ